MNRVFEAICKDGTHALVSPAVIHKFVMEALECANGAKGRACKLFGNRLATFMYWRNYTKLTEIKYDSEGNQKRTVLIVAA